MGSGRTMEKLKEHAGALSYVFVMLVVGVPLWWKTTAVYRAVLPYEAIEALSNIKTVTQKVNILLVTPDAENGHVRGPDLQQLLMTSKVYDLSLSVRTPRKQELQDLESSTSLAALDDRLGRSLSSSSEGWIFLVEAPSALLEPHASVTAGNYRAVYFSRFARSQDIAAMVMDTILGEIHMVDLMDSVSTPGPRSRGAELMRKKSTGEMDLQLSLLVPEPEYVVAAWDIEHAVQKYLKPFLDKFPLKVSVNSQILYLTELNVPGAKEGQGPLEVEGEDLGLALNRVESLLSSQSSSNPALNLILYIPPIHRTPLTIRGSSSNSFLVPRWGGVYIYNYILPDNPSFKFPARVDLDMEQVLGIWLGQLRSLLGVKAVEQTRVLPLLSTGLRHWEIDFQIRYRSVENLGESRSTLQSLSSLLSQINNIVINEDIARRVETALDSLAASVRELNAGRLKEAHTASELAVKQSEAAFFDPSLLALLYFPDDQKYAIYVPYFLPVGLPILLSLKTLIKAIKNKDKKE